MGSAQLEEEDPPLAVRAFFGLPVPDAQRAALGRYLVDCAAAAPAFRWTASANLHLTLRFLGQVETAAAQRIAGNLAALPLRSFAIELGEAGAFRSGRLARVVWLGLRVGADEARELARQLEVECLASGLPAEPRPLHPHLTLARARSRLGSALPELPAPPAVAPWRADEVVLYRSRLGRDGAVYEPLRIVRLS